MDKLQKIILIAGFALLVIGLLPVSSVFAVSNFTVNFEQTPLFSEANFLPGQDITKWVDVTNNTSETEIIGVNAKNYTSCSENCFADQLQLKITNGTTSLYEASLADFFTAGEKKLSDVGAGNTQRYYFIITFVPNAGNQYQSNQVGFDFDIGIFGQETIGGGGTPGGGGTSGGGGTFGGSTGLIIFNEASSPVVLNQTDITWETNHPATSRIIYSAENENHNFDLSNPPNYGYLHSTVEDSSPVINHSVNISGLTSGVTYYYRVVSRGSFAISEEHSFTVPGIMAVETGFLEESVGNIIVSNQGEASGSGGVIVEDNEIVGTGEENSVGEPQNQRNPTNPFLASLLDLFRDGISFCLIIFFFIILVIILLLLSLENKRGAKNKLKRWIASLATIVVLIILYGFICPDNYWALIIVASIIFIAFLVFYFLNKRKKVAQV